LVSLEENYYVLYASVKTPEGKIGARYDIYYCVDITSLKTFMRTMRVNT
jgi:uncharacterized protein (DUF3820 family)